MTKDKIAIVTGANKGLGFAMVKELCEKYEGTVYLTSRDEERGKKACLELEKLGLNPVYHQLDIASPDSISAFIEHINDKGVEVEILINNAGILFLKDTEEPLAYQAEQTSLVNFNALVNFSEAILPYIQNGGKIVNVSSSSGHLSRIPSEELRRRISSEDLSLEELKVLMNSYVELVKTGEDLGKSWGNSPYVVSKVGVNAYTFMLHRRLSARGIAVNCVHPGYLMSDMTRGAGNVFPARAAEGIVRATLGPTRGGLYLWHDGSEVPWDGPDPRCYIDGIRV